MTPIQISQSVAILVDGNNIERSVHDLSGEKASMLNFDTLIPRLLDNRALNRLIYFQLGISMLECLGILTLPRLNPYRVDQVLGFLERPPGISTR